MATVISLRRRQTNKFGAKPTIIHGIRFASKAEARRYIVLKNLEKHRIIWNLTLQPRFKLIVNNIHICTYVADFMFQAKGIDALIVEDVKGIETRDFKIKAKLFTVLYPKHAFYLVKQGKLVRYK